MKIASWNVNSLKVRLEQVVQWCETEQPDVLALQETKTVDEQFPVEAIEQAGYQVVYSGQKTYNGVAILSRSTAEDVVTDIPDLDDPQRRILAATVDGVRVINLYVVNGKEVGSDKYEYKLHWLDKVTQYIESQTQQYSDVVVLGDFNIAPDDRDVHDPESWRDKILCSGPERDALQRIMQLGLSDSFRLHHDDAGIFSWWDYRAAGFRRGLGLRIDLILSSDSLSSCCRDSWVDVDPRTWERPSDHTPVVADFEY